MQKKRKTTANIRIRTETLTLKAPAITLRSAPSIIHPVTLFAKSVTGWIIDGADLSVIAGAFSVSVSVLILIFAVVFLFFCIACVILTVLSYWLIRRKKYKADAWMKIVVFGFALAGCLKLVSFWISILFILPVVLSIIVVFREE